MDQKKFGDFPDRCFLAGRVYVTAFPNLQEFKRHIAEIAWETEVWLCEIPGHLIHFNGEKFMGPYK